MLPRKQLTFFCDGGKQLTFFCDGGKQLTFFLVSLEGKLHVFCVDKADNLTAIERIKLTLFSNTKDKVNTFL